MKVSKNRLFFGLVILMLGIISVLSALGVVDGVTVAQSFWPVILILFGLFGMFSGNSVVWSGVIALSGVWILVFQFDQFPAKNDKLFWPGILIIAAIGFIVSSFTHTKWEKFKNLDIREITDYFCAFGGIKAKNTSQNFKKATASAVFGGIDLDLTEAQIEGDEALVECFTAFGGIDVKVPVGWKIVTHGIPLFGGFENKTIFFKKDEAPEKKLIIKGLALFGGVTVKN